MLPNPKTTECIIDIVPFICCAASLERQADRWFVVNGTLFICDFSVCGVKSKMLPFRTTNASFTEGNNAFMNASHWSTSVLQFMFWDWTWTWAWTRAWPGQSQLAVSPPPTTCSSLSLPSLSSWSPPPSVSGLGSGGGIKGLSPLELMEHHTCAFTRTHRHERQVLQLEMGAFGDLGWGY